MDLTKILSVAGKPGLHKMIAQTKNGLVVESLNDGKRFTAFAHQRISSLEEISIYTYEEDLPLKDVFARIYGHLEGRPAPDPKDPQTDLKAFLEEVVEDYDQERVYVSDIKKMLNWYNQLLEHGLVDDNLEEVSDTEHPEGEADGQSGTEKEESAEEESVDDGNQDK